MARRVLVPESEALTASEGTVVSDAVTGLGMARANKVFHGPFDTPLLSCRHSIQHTHACRAYGIHSRSQTKLPS